MPAPLWGEPDPLWRAASSRWLPGSAGCISGAEEAKAFTLCLAAPISWLGGWMVSDPSSKALGVLLCNKRGQMACSVVYVILA